MSAIQSWRIDLGLDFLLSDVGLSSLGDQTHIKNLQASVAYYFFAGPSSVACSTFCCTHGPGLLKSVKFELFRKGG